MFSSSPITFREENDVATESLPERKILYSAIRMVYMTKRIIEEGD